MASKARKAIDENVKDITRLLQLHQDEGGTEQGRRYGLEVLNKSAIVLLTSFWEAYCEDIAEEALLHIVENAPSADDLPEDLRKIIAKQLKAESHELAVWKLSGEGWRKILVDRLEDLKKERNRRLNTPKTNQINELFLNALGIPKMSEKWHWPKKMNVARSVSKLDKFVELRGQIAHRGATLGTVKKTQVKDYFNFLKRLVGKTGGAVSEQVKKITPVPLW